MNNILKNTHDFVKLWVSNKEVGVSIETIAEKGRSKCN